MDQYTRRTYEEALEIEDALITHFKLGRLFYLNGDLENAIKNWRSIIEGDADGQYPTIRFYVAIALHEAKMERESRGMLADYLRLTDQ